MKTKLAFMILMMGMFISSQVFAQEEVPQKESSKTTVTKTDTKSTTGSETKTSGSETNVKQTTTPPPVQSSKEPPASGTKTSTSSSSKSKSSSSSKQSGTMTTASSASATGKTIYDAEGKMLYKVDATGGWIRDPKNRLVAQYTETGEYYSKNRVKAGSVENGVVRDKDGKEFAKIGKDGKVYTATGKLMGTIAADGTITDDQGKKIGSAPGVDKNIAALVFFVKPANLNNSGSSSNKKK